MPYRTLAKRSRGEDVRLLQNQLNNMGYKAGPVDGVFGFLTERAVTMFQHAKGLPADGIVGPFTWEAILMPERVSAEVIEINLMPISNHGGRGKASLNAAGNWAMVSCWAMPLLSAFGKDYMSGQFYESYVVWLANSEKNGIKKIGQIVLDGLVYKMEETNLNRINDYNLLIITVEINDEISFPSGIPILIGSY